MSRNQQKQYVMVLFSDINQGTVEQTVVVHVHLFFQ